MKSIQLSIDEQQELLYNTITKLNTDDNIIKQEIIENLQQISVYDFYKNGFPFLNLKAQRLLYQLFFKETNVKKIFKIVSKYFGYEFNDTNIIKRGDINLIPRHALVFYLFLYTNLTLKEIADCVKKDRTTLYNSLPAYVQYITFGSNNIKERDKKIRKEIETNLDINNPLRFYVHKKGTTVFLQKQLKN